MYCTQFVEVSCNTAGFDCQNQLTSADQIYNRTVIFENGNVYTIGECSMECQDSDLQTASANLNEYLIGLDELNEIIIEVTPYLSCDWIYTTLDDISDPTCVDAVLGGGYLSIGLLLILLLTFAAVGLGFMGTKRLDVRHHEFYYGDYTSAL
eukprot:TRINITY_DN733_c1_g5_i4.p1 TRINITY_DN733_c1_g5~~TRINITY_DN733_c1_g5_i4.p1  ORF type:complete len:167 (-),score=33.68 TRINITY_DN733_c1_g5_i4:193-648(-)